MRIFSVRRVTEKPATQGTDTWEAAFRYFLDAEDFRVRLAATTDSPLENWVVVEEELPEEKK
jgi:hypothetical protein